MEFRLIEYTNKLWKSGFIANYTYSLSANTEDNKVLDSFLTEDNYNQR